MAPDCGLLPCALATQGTTCSFQTELPALHVFLNNASCHLASPWCVFIWPWPEILLFLSHMSCGVFWTSVGCGNRSLWSHQQKMLPVSLSSVSRITVWNALESVCFCGTRGPPGVSHTGKHYGCCVSFAFMHPYTMQSRTVMSTLIGILNSQGSIPSLWKDFWSLQWASPKGPI